MTKQFLSYEDAKKIIYKLNLTGKTGYSIWAKSKSRPENISSSPRSVYLRRYEWISWGDYLGTNTITTYKEWKKKWTRPVNVGDFIF